MNKEFRDKVSAAGKKVAWSLGMYFMFGYAFGAGSSADYTRALVANQLRDGATGMVTEILPRPSWHREGLVSWFR